MLHELIACMKQQQPSTKLQALSLTAMIHLEPRSTTKPFFMLLPEPAKCLCWIAPLIAPGGGQSMPTLYPFS